MAAHRVMLAPRTRRDCVAQMIWSFIKLSICIQIEYTDRKNAFFGWLITLDIFNWSEKHQTIIVFKFQKFDFDFAPAKFTKLTLVSNSWWNIAEDQFFTLRVEAFWNINFLWLLTHLFFGESWTHVIMATGGGCAVTASCWWVNAAGLKKLAG